MRSDTVDRILLAAAGVAVVYVGLKRRYPSLAASGILFGISAIIGFDEDGGGGGGDGEPKPKPVIGVGVVSENGRGSRRTADDASPIPEPIARRMQPVQLDEVEP